MKYYIDTEFNDFQGDLISIALVPEDSSLPNFYGALECPNPSPWVAENVIPHIGIEPESIESLRERLTEYLIADDHPHIVADWPEDITHLTRLLIIAPGQMVPLRYMSFEYRSFPGFSTASASAIPHNALEDAIAIRDHVIELADWS